MAILYSTGSLLDATETYIVYSGNCQGIINSGVAKAIKERWPIVYEDYVSFDKEIGLRPGDVIITQLDDKKFVACLIIQKYYGRDGNQYVSYDAIKDAFKNLRKYLKQGDTVAISKIGTGLSGGNWGIISNIIEDELEGFSVTCYVFNEDNVYQYNNKNNVIRQNKSI